MNITFKLQGTKEIKKLSVRFYHHKLDLSVALNIMLTSQEWDAVNNVVIGNNEVTIALQELKTAILKQYNKDFCSGVLIDKFWLQKLIKNSFMRPKEEISLVAPGSSIYLTDFATWWLDNKSSDWIVSSKKKMNYSLKNQYKKFVSILCDYEHEVGEKLQLRNIRIDNIKSFVDYLETEDYQVSTIKRHVGRFKFFLNRAKEHDIEISNSYQQRIYFDKDDDIEVVYLNEKEINKIIQHDFSYNEDLRITQQNAIIGLFTGLRSSDFLSLDISNMKEGYFKLKTKKTKSSVVIPVHPEVKKVLDSNFGNLPPKINKTNFNIHIKTICKECEIDYLVYGKLFDKALKRKKIGYFKKFQLISSHVCRRSMVSNLRGKVSDEVIMAVGGWNSTKMISHYDKTTKEEYAKELAEYYNSKNVEN